MPVAVIEPDAERHRDEQADPGNVSAEDRGPRPVRGVCRRAAHAIGDHGGQRQQGGCGQNRDQGLQAGTEALLFWHLDLHRDGLRLRDNKTGQVRLIGDVEFVVIEELQLVVAGAGRGHVAAQVEGVAVHVGLPEFERADRGRAAAVHRGKIRVANDASLFIGKHHPPAVASAAAIVATAREMHRFAANIHIGDGRLHHGRRTVDLKCCRVAERDFNPERVGLALRPPEGG